MMVDITAQLHNNITIPPPIDGLFLRLHAFIKSKKKTSQLEAGSLCSCEVVRLLAPSSDLVTAAQVTNTIDIGP